MKISFNPITFYKRHNHEILRFVNSDLKNLHLINIESFDVAISNRNLETKKINDKNILDTIKKLNNNNYDLIIITDLIEHADNIFEIMHELNKKLTIKGKLLFTSLNPKWYWILYIFEYLQLKNINIRKSIVYPKKIKNLANSSNLELINYYTRQIFPFKLFGIGNFLNKTFEILFKWTNFGLKTYMIFGKYNSKDLKHSKSIIIPAKNESGNLETLFKRMPILNEEAEFIVVCGQSTDGTLEKALEIKKTFNNFNITVIDQYGNGKADAVTQALELTKNDVIAILDSDLSVDPECLIDFFKIIDSGNCDFVNGTRFFYKLEKNSMQFLNIIGNNIFQYLISVVISQKLTDSLCGTKVFNKNLKNKIIEWKKINRFEDPFFDFDLLFTASFSGQRILEYPVHYRARTYGTTQIKRFRDGRKLLIYFLNSFIKFNSSQNK